MNRIELSGTLEIELSEPSIKVDGLYNETSSPTAKIESIKLIQEKYDNDLGEFRKYTDEELNSIAFNSSEITLQSVLQGDMEKVTHKAPNGYFTVGQLLDAILETEKQSRPKSDWFGGIDTSHIYLEGLSMEGDVFKIWWGS